MSPVTLVWGILIGGCGAMAVPHLLIWIWQRRPADLFFVVATAGVIGIAIAELFTMHAGSFDEFVQARRWTYVPIFVLVVGLVAFVHTYFRTGWLPLGLAACALRFMTLIAAFLPVPVSTFPGLTGMRSLRFLGETVSGPTGVVGHWMRIGELSSLLLLIYVVHASISLWRKGRAKNRRRAVVIGGSIVVFVLLAAGMTALTHRQIIFLPYLVSFPFTAILLAMTFELGFDLFQAKQLALKLSASEAILLESEGRFRTTADAAPVLMWMAGPDKLCTFFNQTWLDFTGRTMEQEFGNGWAEGVHADDLDDCLKAYSAAFDARKPFLLEYRLRRHDGEYRWLTDHGVPHYDAAGSFRGYIGACVDTTDLRQKEEAIRDFEQRVTLAAEAAHLGVWELNTETNEFWMSDSARKLFQFDLEAPVTYAEFQQRIHPSDRVSRDLAVKRAIDTGGSYDLEYRALLPDGTVRWIGGRGRCMSDSNGRLTRLVGVSMDVTGRKQAEEKVTQLSLRNEMILNSAAEGILGVDLQGNHVFVNDAAARMLGYESDELLGRHSHTMWHHIRTDGTPYPIEDCNICAAYRDGKTHTSTTEVFWRKDGTSFPVDYSSRPVFAQDRIVGAVVTFMDISERKQMEEEGRRRREQLELLTRVSLLGEMTGSLAHELNQPLAAIASNANAAMRFIDRGKLEPEKLREILVDIVDDGHRAHQIIHNVRNTIKKGPAIRQKVDLNEVISHVAHLVQPDAWMSSCKLNTSLDKDLPKVEADPVQIQQVLVNLISNAFQAMREVPVSQREVEVVTHPNGAGEIRVSVRDHGVGLVNGAEEKIFEQFFTTKADGLGMGLAIVRSIIESHSGKIAAENADGGGARFSFTLPVSN